jgi:hypothetical protein
MQQQVKPPTHSKPKLQINNRSLKSAVKLAKPFNPLVVANQAWVLPVKVAQRAANMGLNKAKLHASLNKMLMPVYGPMVIKTVKFRWG